MFPDKSFSYLSIFHVYFVFSFQLILALIFQNTGDIFYLIEMEGFGFASILVMTFAGQVYLRYKEPDLERPIKVCSFFLF